MLLGLALWKMSMGWISASSGSWLRSHECSILSSDMRFTGGLERLGAVLITAHWFVDLGGFFSQVK